MIFFKLKNKLLFYFENFLFFFINLIFKDIFFAKLFLKISIHLRKKNLTKIKYLLLEFEKKNYIKKIEKLVLSNVDSLKKKRFFPDLFIYYFNTRLNDNFEKTFKAKFILLKNDYLSNKKFNYFDKLEFQNLDKDKFIKKINLFEKEKKNRDLEFKNYICGKRVALVGPADSDFHLGGEIDSFDIVIRPNYKENSNKPFSVYGSKTNVSYYNSYRVAEKKEDIINIHKKLDWIVFKSEKDIQKIGLINDYNKFRVTRDPINFFLFEDPMLPQRIIYDVVSFKPSYFKIFHFDLYNSKNYNESYKSWHLNKKIISNSLRSHGPMSCFIFMKNFHKRNFFFADDETTKVLNLDVIQYGKNLDKNYGKLEYDTKY